MTRNEAREILMQIMYEMEASKDMTADNGERLAEERLSGNHKTRGAKLLRDIAENLQSIDETINDSSKAWKTSRMSKVDLAIIRLAVGEIIYSPDVPTAVAINEAINLAKKYSAAQSARFINGVLGAAAKSDRIKTND